MPSPISLITLLTDFGLRDYFVPSMKGVMLGINSQARLIDLSHQVTPHSIEEAAFILQSSYHYFPDGTVHVVVVDPGVGSDRRALLVSTSRYFFLAPDNGVLSGIIAEELDVEVRHIENKQYRLDSEGATFEGRDLFAPAAAWLTKGQVPGSYGRLIRDYVTIPLEAPTIQSGTLIGRVVYIDHFGNVITNITKADLQRLKAVTKREPEKMVLGNVVIHGIKTAYIEGAAGVPEALINSNGKLECFVKQGRAVDRSQAKIGQRVEVS